MRQSIRPVALCLAVLLLLSLVPVPARAEGSLSGATVTLSNEVYEYNGSAIEPDVVVTLDNLRLQRDVDYTLRYSNNRTPGTGRVTVTGIGAYQGETTASFYIRPRVMELNRDLSFRDLPSKSYDGGTDVSFPATLATVGGDSVTATCRGTFSDPYVGANKSLQVNSVTLSGRDSGNYVLDLSYPIPLSNGQITAGEPKVRTSAEVAAGGTLDLNSLVTKGAGQTVRFSADLTGQGSALSPSGVLTAGAEPETLRISVTADPWDANGDGTPEYTLSQKSITVRVVEKQTQAPVTTDPVDSQGKQAALVFSGSASVYYNDTLSLNVTGGSGSGAVTYTVRPISGDATVDSRGVLTPKKAGTVWVTAQKQGDSQYSAGTPVSLEVTIRPARITIQAADQTAAVGDPVPVLDDGDYRVTGLKAGEYLKRLPTLSYDPQPDMTQPGSVSILVSDAQVPATGNYAPEITYRPGTLTITEAPLYAITLQQGANGTISADRETAQAKERVVITAQPAENCRCTGITVRAANGSSVDVGMQREGIYAFRMPASAVTVSAAFQVQAAKLPFTDVKSSDWFYASVDWAWRAGLMNGTSATLFSPNQSTSRAMIVTLLYRLEGSPEAPKRNPFRDVKGDAYYAGPVAWAAWNGIVSGYSANTFGPNDPITREQFAAILWRYAQYRELDVSGGGTLAAFTDGAKVSSYAREAMAWANGAGLITGKGGGVLDPKGKATRAQAAAILQRFDQQYPRGQAPQ